MNRYLVLISVFLALCACKTQSTIHYPQSTIHDSVSITYKQGTEQPSPSGLRGAAIESTRNKKGAAIAMAVNSPQGVRNPREISVESVRDIKIRVDTVFIERWHTQTIREPTPPPPGGGREGASKFYKDCTWGFFILLLLILGRIALRITKAICLRR